MRPIFTTSAQDNRKCATAALTSARHTWMDFSQLRLLTRRSAGSGPTRFISQPRFGDVSNLQHWHCQPAACFASCNLQPILHTFRRACNLQPDNQPCRLKETSTHNLQQHIRRSRGHVAHGRQQLVGALTCDANRPLSQPASAASWVCDGAPEPSAEFHWKPFRNECSERRITGQRPRLCQNYRNSSLGPLGSTTTVYRACHMKGQGSKPPARV